MLSAAGLVHRQTADSLIFFLRNRYWSDGGNQTKLPARLATGADVDSQSQLVGVHDRQTGQDIAAGLLLVQSTRRTDARRASAVPSDRERSMDWRICTSRYTSRTSSKRRQLNAKWPHQSVSDVYVQLTEPSTCIIGAGRQTRREDTLCTQLSYQTRWTTLAAGNGGHWQRPDRNSCLSSKH